MSLDFEAQVSEKYCGKSYDISTIQPVLNEINKEWWSAHRAMNHLSDLETHFKNSLQRYETEKPKWWQFWKSFGL